MANALIRESSPYLLQHAHNPVDWHAWGPEALALAGRRSKPIFLSVGYSTCYWCHVMERQCFENPGIAALMNEHFVNIKVDREERPDIDEVFMTAAQMMTGRGGWPMSVFLTPPPQDESQKSDASGLCPFYAGTYFPPEPSHGMPSFPQVLTALAEAWAHRRGEVLEQAGRIAEAVRQRLSQIEAERAPDAGLIKEAANQLARAYDPVDGGFGGEEGPKFPQACNLQFLIKVHQNNPNAELWHALAHTLDRMARGGMYDQVGGGFHRYSTDGRWLVPHFEKMLYDNAQLVEVYLTAQAIRPHDGDPTLYERIVRQTCDYVLREMTDQAGSGAFYSAQDAEVGAQEGANYLWQAEQVKAAVKPKELADLALDLYGLNEEANFQDPHDPGAPPAHVLYLREPLDAVTRRRNMTLDQAINAKSEIDRQLLAARARREQPRTDDKVLAAWNGMMVAALARAGAQLDEPRYVQAAARAARGILERMRDAEGGLFRTMRQGIVKVPAFLDDYASFIHGLIELHRADGGAEWLTTAEELARAVERTFGAGDASDGDDSNTVWRGVRTSGGYFDARPGQGDLFVRTRSIHDSAIPSANSQMVHNLLDLFELTGEPVWQATAAASLGAFGAAMERYGAGMAHMHHALLRLLELAPHQFDATAADSPVSASSPRAPGVTGGPPPVSVTCEPSTVDLSSGEAVVRIKVTIAPGFHINADGPTAAGLVPTVLTLRDAPGLDLDVAYPPAEEKLFSFADRPLRVYEGRIEIKAIVRRVGEGPPSSTSRLILRYQACTDRSCLAPAESAMALQIRPIG